MATRQLRISDHHQIKNSLRNFLGKKINIVLSNDTTMFGTLKEVTENEIILVNMRLKAERYRIADIAEIYLDTVH
jgi:hypothetical protein